MSERAYPVVVVGRGLIGSAALRHLAGRGLRCALVGPDEPADRSTHEGPFASHHDAGRITRRIDPQPLWATLAARSIERYAELERATGERFHHPVGALMAGPDAAGSSAYVRQLLATAGRLDVPCRRLDAEALSVAFRGLRLPPGSVGVLEPAPAGYIDPRAMVRAQLRAATAAGAEVLCGHVAALDPTADGLVLTLADGGHVRAQRVLLATGAWSHASGLVPVPVPVQNKARTIVLAEVPEDWARHAGALPSLILELADHPDLDNIYWVPPARYPDGRLYLKIGGDYRRHATPRDAGDLRDWFRSDGNPAEAAALHEVLASLLPSLGTAPTHARPCVTSYTPDAMPIIDHCGDARLCLVTDGCGVAAKSADELGRLAADLIATGQWHDTLDAAPFRLDRV